MDLYSTLVAFPTVIFTGLMALVLLYWLFVILGAVDVDMFSAKAGVLDAAAAKAGAIDALTAKGGAADGAIDAIAGKAGAADGILDALDAKAGAAEGLLDGADGAEAAAEGAAGASASASLLSAINLRRAPVTVTFSLVVFFGWIASYIGMVYLAPPLTTLLPGWLVSSLVLCASILLALPLTSLATLPLEPVFRKRPQKTRRDFVGSVCRIQTGRVDGSVGQAILEDGGAGLIIQVRGEAGSLERGQSALIIDYDAEREAYLVEAYDKLLQEEASDKAARRRG